MPSLQELLVSYSVKIDESGVSRLHTLLDLNRKKAADAAAAFATLESGIVKLGKVLEQFTKRYPNFGLSGLSSRLVHPEASLFEGGARRAEGVSSDTGQRTRELSRFASVLSESIRSSVSTVTNRTNTYNAGASGSGSFALNADTSPVQEAIDGLTRFIASKAPTMRMKGDASGLITAASNAAGRVKSILSDVKVDIGGSDPGAGKGPLSTSVMQFSSTGGRFDMPTTTQVAEDGDTEYIIPVRKEKKAVPLIMQMMGELSFNAYQSVLSQLGVQHLQTDVNKFMSMLRSLFKTAAAEGAILRNPMDLVKRPKCKKTVGHRALEEWERQLITSTYQEHDFGLCAMTMLYSGLRRGEALYLDVDRDVDFENNTITVRGAVSLTDNNQPQISEGKTEAAQRVVPLVPPLAKALEGHHGLVCCKEDGGLMSYSSFKRKYESYIAFLEQKINGCKKGWYGKLKEHKALAEKGELPPWQAVTIRCHDFRVDFCTRCYYAGIPLKTLQNWMGHTDADMILGIYSKMTKEQEINDALKLSEYMNAV